ncbi:unnamed protein product [Sphagnum jensenii]|uniref:Mitochondrial import inner membrane translocase subunit Tim21 n=1 Tax=Sphagnum jensenii TaxID=128206 RepID=A0ABP1BQM2_9BRYO
MSWRSSRTALRKVGTYSYYCMISQFFFRFGGSRIIWFVAAAAVLVVSSFRGVLLTEILRYSSSSLSQGSGTLPKVRKELLLPFFPYSVQCLTSQPVPKFAQYEESRGLSKQQEEDSLTDKVPEKPVTVAEGASYSLVILAGLAVAAAAACAVFKELIFEPREYVLCFPLLGS